MSEVEIYKISISGNVGVHSCYEGINILSRLFVEINKEEVYFAKNIDFNINLDFIPGNMLVVLGSIIMDIESQGKNITLNTPKKLYDFILHSGFANYINTKNHLEGPLNKSVVLPFSRLSNQSDFTKYLEKYREYIPSDDRDVLVGYLSELHYNSIEHGDTQDIFLISQKYPNLGLIDMTIYDSGQGMLNTNKGDIFLKVYNIYCSERFFSYVNSENGHNIFFIILCVCTKFSSKGIHEGGLGLWELSRYLYTHNGKLSIATEKIFIQIEFLQICDILDLESVRYEVKELENKLPGTYISFTFSV